MTRIPVLPAVTLALGVLAAPSLAREDDGPAKGVRKIEAVFDPAEAKPGQTVTLKITVELADGYHTYPTKQTDKNAAAMVNKITFPAASGVVFVGDLKDPDKPATKAEPELGIKELKTHSGTVVFEKKVVVSPKASAGEQAAKPKVRILVCDATTCFPPKTLTPEAKLTVLAGPPVAVEKQYEAEVKKALAEMK
jgi:hypothetical protein